MRIMTNVLVTVTGQVSFDYMIRADNANAEILAYAEKCFAESARNAGLNVIGCQAQFAEKPESATTE